MSLSTYDFSVLFFAVSVQLFSLVPCFSLEKRGDCCACCFKFDFSSTFTLCYFEFKFPELGSPFLDRFIRPEDVPTQYGGLSRPSDLQNGPPKPASEFTVKGGEKVNIQIEGIEVHLLSLSISTAINIKSFLNIRCSLLTEHNSKFSTLVPVKLSQGSFVHDVFLIVAQL